MFKASPFRLRKRPFILLFAGLVSAIVLIGDFLSKKPAAAALPTVQQDLQRRLRKYEVARLDRQLAVEAVQRTGKFSIVTPSRTFELELVQNDLRAPNYRAEETTAEGFSRELPTMPVRTYKGRLVGEPGSEARFTIDEGTFEGLIITADEWYFVEEARKYSPTVGEAEYLVYKASDVIPDRSFACAVTLKEQVELRTEQLPVITPELVSPMRVVEVATEADFEYVTALGSSTAANNEILSIMNQVQGIYESQVGLTFNIVFQHTWDTSADPYTASGTASSVLTEFRTHWNANFTSVLRDTAFLWTGRTISDAAGVAYVGAICRSPSFSYGLSERINNSLFKVTIPAHEIGHNLDAGHSDGTAGCENTIMQGVATPSTTFNFCQLSIDQMTTFVNANSSCLALAGSSSQVQFSNASYSANESTGMATLTITRTGSTSGTATVEFVSADGSALQRTDYTTTAGTVSFAPGETSKTVDVLISDDLYVEGNETISVTLSNVSGATLGNPGTATLTVMSNDVAQPTSNPLDNAQFFVRQHYYDFLNRQADAGGLGYWSGQITSCGSDQSCIRSRRLGVSNAFFYELEFQQTGAYVYRLYRAAYGNNQPFPNPDTTNITEARKIPRYDVFVRDRARVVGGSNMAQTQLALASAFVLRPEFVSVYGSGLSGPAFVDAMLSRIATDSGVDLNSQRSALITLFNQGGRGAVLYRLADDNVQTNPINNRIFIDAEYNRSFVYTQYAGYLRRDADTGGFLFWLGQVNGFPIRHAGIQSTMVCAFITSNEYQQRFSSVVTRSNSECGP
jgi:hypothetical protein